MCSPEDFVKAWQTSNSRRDVCRKTGMSEGTLDARAWYYRKRGVTLKRFRRTPYNWQALAALARRLAA